MHKDVFSWKARIRSFRYAFNGIAEFLYHEHNTWIHLAATIVCVILAFIAGVNTCEAIALLFSIAFVWITELINTAIERIMDYITTERRQEIKVIKDLAAAAVLVAAITALVTGCIVFIPKFFYG